MRLPFSLGAALCLLPLLAEASPGQPKPSPSQCGLSTDYNVLVDGGGVWLYRERGLPREIRIHGGGPSIDGQVQAVSAADALRLRELEAQAREMMPQVAGLAREAVDLGFDALAAVVDGLGGSRRKARQVDGMSQHALAHVDRTLGAGRWDQDVFGPEFEARVERAAEQMAASLGRSVLFAVFTPGGAERLERRSEKMEAEIERRVEPRRVALEAPAAALCEQAARIDELQRALEYRFDGRPLQLLRREDRALAQADAD